jgi:hypothetical protein
MNEELEKAMENTLGGQGKKFAEAFDVLVKTIKEELIKWLNKNKTE